jgi:Zn-dependent protease with chaperone function
MPMVSADYYDGKSARAHSVRLSLSADALLVQGDGIDRREPLHTLHVSEPMGAAPRLIKFADGAHCEVRDHAALAALLEAGGHRDGWVVRLQSRWGWALAAVIIAVAGGAAGYRWGLPAVSEWIAFKLPDKALAQMGQSTLAFLDEGVLSPSSLPAARQHSLSNAFEKLAVPDGMGAGHEIVFRNGRAIGANAFALPDGTIVVTDQLVSLARHDEEIIAVLAHELGHLSRRHSLRMLIQGSIVGFVAAWYLGDVSNVAAGLPTVMLQARYSRDHEREADEYAAAMLKANGISPSRLADMLEKLEQAHASKKSGEDGEQTDVFGGYLASHPATSERIKALERD